MTIRFNPRWLFVLSLIFSLQLARAQVVIPPIVSFNLGDPSAPDTQLWDIGGSYSIDMIVVDRNGVSVPVTISFTLNQDNSGRLSNPAGDNAEGLVINNNSFFTITPRITGKVTGFGGTARVHLSMQFHGSGTFAGQNVNSFSGSFSFDAETDSSTGQLSASKAKFSASFAGLSDVHGTIDDLSMALPRGINAGWTLTLRMAGQSRVSGTGVIGTSARSLGYDLSGSLKGGFFNIKAKGGNVQDTISGAGSSAKIELPSDFSSISLFKGKILGQTLIFSFPED